MLVKCPECGHENQLGAIFCRNCGTKLNIEELRPTVKDKESGFKIGSFIRKLVALVILLALVGILAGLFVPYGFKEYPVLADEETIASIKDKMDFIQIEANGGLGKGRYAFTPEEASYLYNTVFLDKMAEGGSSYNIGKVNFEVGVDNTVWIIMDSKMFGKVPMRFQIRGEVIQVEPSEEETGKKDEKGKKILPLTLGFKVLEAKMGHLSIPQFLQNKVTEKFDILVDSNVRKVLCAIADIKVNEEGSFVITMKEQ
jgi:ribosomal protein L40E